jgi:hypothetical protein
LSSGGEKRRLDVNFKERPSLSLPAIWTFKISYQNLEILFKEGLGEKSARLK